MPGRRPKKIEWIGRPASPDSQAFIDVLLDIMERPGLEVANRMRPAGVIYLGYNRLDRWRQAHPREKPQSIISTIVAQGGSEAGANIRVPIKWLNAIPHQRKGEEPPDPPVFDLLIPLVSLVNQRDYTPAIQQIKEERIVARHAIGWQESVNGDTQYLRIGEIVCGDVVVKERALGDARGAMRAVGGELVLEPPEPVPFADGG